MLQRQFSGALHHLLTCTCLGLRFAAQACFALQLPIMPPFAVCLFLQAETPRLKLGCYPFS